MEETYATFMMDFENVSVNIGRTGDGRWLQKSSTFCLALGAYVLGVWILRQVKQATYMEIYLVVENESI